MAAKSLALQVGVAPACRALGVPRATFYRRHRMVPGRQQPRCTPARALCEDERERVLETLSSPRFVDRAPGEVVATLLDEGQYLCSERTMYRILAASEPVRERRNQLTHPSYTKPELVATAPNETGHGISRAFWGRNAGRTFTCTCCSTSSADMWSGGWSPNGRTRRWPHGSSSKPASSKASSPRR